MGIGDFYANKTPTHVGRRSKQILNRRLLKRILVSSPGQSSRILEIGSGHGIFAEACVEAGHDYCGIEPHAGLNDLLCKAGYSVRKAVCPPIPHESDQFDLVYAGWVLEYLPGPREAFDFIQECLRVVKPGGLVAMVSSDYIHMKGEFWDVGYNVGFATTGRRIWQLYYDSGLQHRYTSYFAGNLFDWSRYLGYLFNFMYRYRWIEGLIKKNKNLQNSRLYKLRFTFPEAVLVVGTK